MKQALMIFAGILAASGISFAQVTRPVPDQVTGRVSEGSLVTPTAPVTEPPLGTVENMPSQQPSPLDFNLFDTYQTYPPYEDSRMTGSSTEDMSRLQRPEIQETQRTQAPPNLAPGLDSVTTTTVPSRK
jgi:hypothetical protein